MFKQVKQQQQKNIFVCDYNLLTYDTFNFNDSEWNIGPFDKEWTKCPARESYINTCIY